MLLSTPDLDSFRKGKIEQATLGKIHVILIEILKYFSNQILQTKLPVNLVLVFYRPANQSYNNCKYCFSSFQGAFSYNL